MSIKIRKDAYDAYLVINKEKGRGAAIKIIEEALIRERKSKKTFTFKETL